MLNLYSQTAQNAESPCGMYRFVVINTNATYHYEVNMNYHVTTIYL